MAEWTKSSWSKELFSKAMPRRATTSKSRMRTRRTTQTMTPMVNSASASPPTLAWCKFSLACSSFLLWSCCSLSDTTTVLVALKRPPTATTIARGCWVTSVSTRQFAFLTLCSSTRKECLVAKLASCRITSTLASSQETLWITQAILTCLTVTAATLRVRTHQIAPILRLLIARTITLTLLPSELTSKRNVSTKPLATSLWKATCC